MIDDLALKDRSNFFVTRGEEAGVLRQTQGLFDFACRLILIFLFTALLFTALIFATLLLAAPLFSAFLTAPNPDQAPRSAARRRRLDPTAGLRHLTPLGRLGDAT